VKPAPATFTGQHWLSAEQLVLKEEWSGDNQQMKVGEPLTRTLSLLAKGTTVGQVPELNAGKTNDQLKAYSDQPILQEQKKPEGLIAFREEKIAIIPSKAGQYKLPAIEIPWFNTHTRKIEVAKIPETTITAIDAAGVQIVPVVPVTPATEPSQKITETPLIQPQQTNIWLGVAIFLALGWLVTLAYFLIKRTAKKPVIEKNQTEIRLQDCVKRLKNACADNDSIAAKDALLAWGQQKFSNVFALNLGAIAELSDARLRDEILYLNQVLYGKDADQWQGKKLFQAFIENKAREKTAVPADDKLEPLYRL
jgi:hypothetical protein